MDGEPLTEGEEKLPPAVVLWRWRDYFEKNRERIRYGEFRRRGLPSNSSQAGSAIGRTNVGVKAANKSWFLDHAEEMSALRTQALPEDGRWDDHFDGLRRGEIQIPTRADMKPIEVFPWRKRSSLDPAA